MKTLRVILTDQLSLTMSSLKDIDPATDHILMIEAREEFTHVKHHQKKIAFLLSAMRHFAEELRAKKYRLTYIKLDDPQNSGHIAEEITRNFNRLDLDKIVVTWPADYRQYKAIKDLKLPLEILEDDRFLSTRQEFDVWASSRKELRMEFFYRQMRVKHDILMEEGKPVGGKWNYDAENRKFPKEKLSVPAPYTSKPDEITRTCITLTHENFFDHFGDLDPFYFAVTRDQALEVLDKFIAERLSQFGDFQDAMIENEPWMYHSHISFYVNVGLLNPLECIRAAEIAYLNNQASLNAVEGFIRQILGWREYVRGIYWHFMPDYKDLNFFDAKRKLPSFFWDGKSKMNCLNQCITETKENAYAHHIQRLMVLGNFLLLIGVHPDEVNEWYLLVYADAFEWVELPNVTGMILFADGGKLASKPYAASGAYINKMSNYCKGCTYKVTVKNGPDACPFNYLYWHFLDEHYDKLKGNHRLGMIYKTFLRMSDEKREDIRSDAASFLASLT